MKQMTNTIKACTFDEKETVGFIDLGSDCVTLRKSDAISLGIKYLADEIKLRDFGGGECLTIGRRMLLMKIEEVELEVEVLIVVVQEVF